jgi:hypothetical protein
MSGSDGNTPLRQRLSPCVEQRYPEFEKHFQAFRDHDPRRGTTRAYYFHPTDCRDWHNRMVEKMLAREPGRHFPVFRMSHGEFMLALGYRYPRHSGKSRLWCDAITLYHQFRRWTGLEPAFRSGSHLNSYEEFTKQEVAAAEKAYIANLGSISREGILAAAFYDNPGYSEYFPDFFNWMDRRGIVLHTENYVPFYSVYALLAGSRLREIVDGRDVLITTSFRDDKAERLEACLMKLGARGVQCYATHPSKAIFERIDLSRIRSGVDVALVGAGVGAAAVIEQLRPLGALCIDAGFCLDMLAYPELRWERPYCAPDPIFDLSKVKFLGEERKARLLAKHGTMAD